MRKFLGLLILVISLAVCCAQIDIQNNVNAPDVPGFSGNLRTVAAGSLIIPMEAALQVLVPGTGKMSVLPYGLIIRSLYDNVTASWAITTGKQLNGVDFTVASARSNWAALAAAGETAADPNWGGWQTRTTTSYSGGPFIIPAQYARKALRAWAAWRANPAAYLKTVDANVYNDVQIHIMTQAATIDLRHNLFTRPFVGVSNLAGNAPTQTAMMGCVYKADQRKCPQTGGYGAGAIFNGGVAGCKAFSPNDHAGLDWGTHYNTYDCPDDVASLTSESCLSTFSEPHWQWDSTSGPSYISAVKQFVTSGANFFAQCASVGSYETFASGGTDGTFMSKYGELGLKVDAGINNNDQTSQNTVTNYPDLPVNQYIGLMSSNMWGTIPDFYNKFSNGDQTPPAGFSATSGQPSDGAYNDFKTNAFPLVTNIYNSAGDSRSKGRNVYVASGAKYNSNLQLGSNVFYLGGHQWVNLATPGAENNRRFFFNAIVVPASRPASCGFNFCDPGTSCDPRTPCETCVCDASGTNFKYTPIPGCCLSNGDCTADCTVCNTNSHTCELVAGCCSTTINCTTACQSCQNTNAAGVGSCAGTAGCCTADNQCTTTSKCIHCENQACVTTPAPACCDAPSDCTGTCMTCTTNTCARVQPLSDCCLTNSDCGTDACVACNPTSHTCYRIPGCCNVNTDCGVAPCVRCNATTHSCYNKEDCCTVSGQCGACQECSNSTNLCVASSDANCCTTNDDCGTCRRCAVAVGGAKTCLNIPDCCVSSGDCTTCQYCSNSTCTAVDNCCSYDSDCSGCDVCKNFTCVANYDLSCCFTNDDCEIARQEMMLNPNATDIPQCDLVCNKDFSNRAGNGTGVCQTVCSSPKNWTGLIVGLAAGVPLGLLCLGAIAAGLIAFLLWKRDALTGALLTKGTDPGMNANTNPAFDSPVTVGTSGL